MDEYGILRGYEERLDEDDEEGSIAIPSRTAFGSESAFVKDFSQYGATKRFFFGLITERNWGYRCELTLPQIELMQSDLPHTLYKKKGTSPKVDENDDAFRLQEEANKRAAARHKKNGEYTIEEVFAGAADE